MREDYIRKRVNLFINQVKGKVPPPATLNNIANHSFLKKIIKKRASKDSL